MTFTNFLTLCFVQILDFKRKKSQKISETLLSVFRFLFHNVKLYCFVSLYHVCTHEMLLYRTYLDDRCAKQIGNN